jgi:hypothetical protein
MNSASTTRLGRGRIQVTPTIYAGALKDLACLACGTKAVALDLYYKSILADTLLRQRAFGFPRTLNAIQRTLRFRHDLQFIDSRGSLHIRRVGSRSMLTCGRDMGARGIRDGAATAPGS